MSDTAILPRVLVAVLAALVLNATIQSVPIPATLTIRVEVRTADGAVAGASVRIGDRVAETDAAGLAVLEIPAGRVTVIVTRDGFLPAETSVDAAAQRQHSVVVTLEPAIEHEEEVTVSATRTGRRLDDQPMRVEVLGREEIEEKLLMTPGDIVMMLNEMGGMRVQATSPSLGAASVRIQGMRGRYTRVLSDGLPLHGQQVGGLGLLQIPPMDLGQVEVIKGVASALYGAGAMGGVIDLVSRRPTAEAEREFLFNATTRGGADAIAWLSGPLAGGWGGTLLAGGHIQHEADVDDDGWADLPSYSRLVVRPRVSWTANTGASFFGTAGVTVEDRTGGTVDGAVLSPTGAPYLEALDTRRVDAGALATWSFAERYVGAARAAVSTQHHDHRFGETLERDRHTNLFGELAVRGSAGDHTWVVGMAVEHDAYRPRDVARFEHTFAVPGLFAQDDVDIRPWLAVSASARLDWHSDYGTFFSPRVSLLARAAAWTARVSGGTGFFAPSALTEETEAAGLTRLEIPEPLRAEEGRGISADVTHTRGPFAFTATWFASRVSHPAVVFRESSFQLVNLAEPTTNTGAEATVSFRQAPFVATGTYTFVRSRETAENSSRVESALTPRHAAGLVVMAESEHAGRVGLELYYTGRQRLEANPYRGRSEPYVILGILAERRFGLYRLFVNFENLTGVRQSEWDPLLRPSPGSDGRWTVDAWAPIEGAVINGGVRIAF